MIVQPARNLFNILASLSFYNILPGCKISWTKGGLACVQSALSFEEEVNATVKYIRNLGDYLDMDWKNINESFISAVKHSSLPRCYAHEGKPNEKKKKKEKPTDKEKFKRSILFYKNKNSSMVSILKEARKHCTEERIREVLFVPGEKPCPACGGCYDSNICLCGTKLYKRKDTGDYKNYTINLIPKYVACNAAYEQALDDSLPVRFVFLADALKLFPTHLCGRKVVVDGQDRNVLNVPLTSRPVDKEEWLMFLRHPHIGRWKEKAEFWKRAGVLCVRQFRVFQKLKSNVFEEISR